MANFQAVHISAESPTARNYYDQTPPSEVAESGEDGYIHFNNVQSENVPKVAVIGVGYVGEHLVDAFSTCYDVIGYDVSLARVNKLTQESTSGAYFTNKSSDIAVATHFLISVPTLLLPNQNVDSSYLRQAIAVVAKYGRPGATVVIESSVAVGMTRELLGSLAKEKSFKAGMSPERVDPGRTFPPARSIPKIVSGLDDIVPGSIDAIAKLYSKAFDKVVPVSKPEVAEMMKLYENCQRMVCIAYANEMADACQSHNIDPFEVCQVAATKPFGYLPFSPGIGVGGHCIPINPFYLFSNNRFPLLEMATESMRARPSLLAQRIIDKLHNPAGSDHTPRVLVVGMGFKPGQSHVVNSPGLELAKNLLITGRIDITWADPLVSQEAIPQIRRIDDGCWNANYLKENFDFIVAAMKQTGLDFNVLRMLTPQSVEWWFA